MIRGNQFDRRQGDGHPMPEPRLWDRHIVTNGPPGSEESVHGDRTKQDDYAHGGEEPHLALEIRLAVAELRRRGPVPRGSASHRGGDVAIAQPKAVRLRDRRGLIRESVPVKGAKQPLAAPISREDAAGPIPSVGRRGEADDQQPGAAGSAVLWWSVSQPGAPVSDQVQLSAVRTGLPWPIALAFSPDGRVFFAERFTGRIQVLGNTTILDSTFFTIPEVASSGEQGL